MGGILQQPDHKFIGQIAPKHSGRYSCRATGLNYARPLVFEVLSLNPQLLTLI